MKVGDVWTGYDAEDDATGGADISFGINGNIVAGTTYPFTFPTVQKGTYMYITINNETWHAIYDDPTTPINDLLPSPGGITIKTIDDKTGFVRGTFTATKATTASSQFKRQTTMKGNFWIQKLPQ